MRKARLAIFTTHPIQYQAPMFRELARHPSLDPVVLFGSRHGLDVSLDKGFGATFQWDIPLLEGYDHVFLENIAETPDVDRFRGITVSDAKQILREQRADSVLVLGWQTVAHLQFMRAAHALGIPLLVRGESNLLRRIRPSLRALARTLFWLPARELIYRAMFGIVNEFLVIGTRNAEFYRHFGVPAHKLRWAPYAVENSRFALPADERERVRCDHRRAAGIGDTAVTFVCSAKIIERKRPFDLLAAFDLVAATVPDVHLIYLGDGPHRAALEADIQRRGLQASVSITGFVNQRSIPQWYATADCVVLPSDHLETWGLAVNEGMAAGCAAIVSDAVGCAPDLVSEGENGYRFSYGDVHALAERMTWFAQLPAQRRREMGERSREIVARFTIEQVVSAVETAVRHSGNGSA